MTEERGRRWREIGARVREARVKVGLTQAGVARLLGVSPHSVWSWENAKTQPNHEHLMELASRCEVSTDWLLGRDVVEAEVLREDEPLLPGGRRRAARRGTWSPSGSSSVSCASGIEGGWPRA